MKKYILFLLVALLLVGCGNSDGKDKNKGLTTDKAIPFEIVHYANKIAPVYAGLVPTIAYAETEGQFQELKARFDLEDANFDVDMENNVVAFVVAFSGSCNIAVDSAYNDDNKFVVKLMEPQLDHCEPTQEPHTFVITTPKQDFEKAQLYIGDIIKASVEVKR